MKPRILIADDEPNLRAHLNRLLQRTWPEAEIVACTANGVDTQEALKETQPDVAFLDIRMPPPNGLQLAEQLTDSKTHVVFVTAYNEYAIAAFEKNACDYLQKPVSVTRLRTTVERLKARLETNSTANIVASIRDEIEKLQPSTMSSLIPVKHRGSTKVIAVADIVYFKSDAKYTLAYDEKDEYLLSSTLKDLEAKLNRDEFWRIHRNCIVNAHRIDVVTHETGGITTVRMIGRPEELRVSRPYRSRFREL